MIKMEGLVHHWLAEGQSQVRYNGSLEEQVSTVLATSRDHTEITAKLWHGQCGDPPEVQLNRSPITENKKKPH